MHRSALIRSSIVSVLALSAVVLAGCSDPVPPVVAPQPPVVEPPKEPPPAEVVAPIEPPKEVTPPPPIQLPSPVTFATGTASLASASDAALSHVVDYLAKSPDVAVLRIEGHTDSRGVASSNQRLSEQRALAVAKWLVGHGVDCKRVVPIGFGDTDPIADNGSEDGRAQNRRTVFVDNRTAHAGGHAAGDACPK